VFCASDHISIAVWGRIYRQKLQSPILNTPYNSSAMFLSKGKKLHLHCFSLPTELSNRKLPTKKAIILIFCFSSWWWCQGFLICTCISVILQRLLDSYKIFIQSEFYNDGLIAWQQCVLQLPVVVYLCISESYWAYWKWY